MNAADKYCASFAEPDINLLPKLPVERQQYLLVIPAYKENYTFFEQLYAGLLQKESVLLVLVINQPSSEVTPNRLNHQLFEYILSKFSSVYTESNLTYGKLKNSYSSILLVNRFRRAPIDLKEGVGKARKIGNDIGLHLIRQGLIQTPVLFNTDADTRLPENYFQAIKPSPTTSAWVYPFRHHCDNSTVGRATHLYETRIEHFRSGLEYAGSPYAFHTIGSTLAIDPDCYAKVRGFPKRAAGEDFYLLNKLAKIFPVSSLKEPVITIEARSSDRIPFGTGPAVSRLLHSQHLEAEPIFYNPAIFEHLKGVLSSFNSLPSSLDECNISPLSQKALRSLGIEVAFRHLTKQCKTTQQYLLHIHHWFDAFRTLKFVHYLRDNHFPNISYHQLKAENLTK